MTTEEIIKEIQSRETIENVKLKWLVDRIYLFYYCIE